MQLQDAGAISMKRKFIPHSWRITVRLLYGAELEQCELQLNAG